MKIIKEKLTSTLRFLFKIYLTIRDYYFLTFMPKKFEKVAKQHVLAPNPILKLNPNTTCFCGTNKKIKKCCGQYNKIPLLTAEKIEAALEKYNITKENGY